VKEVLELTKTVTKRGLATDKDVKVGEDEHNHYISIEIIVIGQGKVKR
jgi:hypothetical protein